MNRATDYLFVSQDTSELRDSMVGMFEELTKKTLIPGSPEYVFISWVLAIIQQERALINYTANQNLPSRAEGDNLDALADLFYLKKRPEGFPSTCTIRFNVSEAPDRGDFIKIPKGTRVTDASGNLVMATDAEAYVPANATYVDIPCTCTESGTSGNGYAPGQINTIVDVYMYYSSCSNITESANGSDVPSDEEFYEMLVDSLGAYSTAGSKSSYVYHAKSASDQIIDVAVTKPSAGCVNIYLLKGEAPYATIPTDLKAKVSAAVGADDVRPLTDNVSLPNLGTLSYNINLTYYMDATTVRSAADIKADIDKAVSEYRYWQETKIGRDVNPSKLIGMLMQIDGVKRVALTSPSYASVGDGSDGNTPKVAIIGTETVTNGGYEDD